MLQAAIRNKRIYQMRGWLGKVLILCVTLVLVFVNSPGQQNTQDVPKALVLEPGKVIEREIAGEQVQSYLVKLIANEFLRVTVDQRGVDVVVTVLEPNGKELMKVDSPNGTQGPEPVLLIAESAGQYRLDISALEKGAIGKYSVKIDVLRAATEPDRQEVLLAEAQQLAQQVQSLFYNGKYDEAIAAALRALAIREKILGPDHRDVAELLADLGLLYESKNNYGRAELLYLRALNILKGTGGEGERQYASTLNNLAGLYRTLGDYARAKPLFVRSLEIREKILPPNHIDVAQGLNDLGLLNHEMGDYVSAELLLVRALAIFEQIYRDKPHSDLAAALNNLAFLYRDKGDLARAEPLLRRALDIVEKALPAEHPLHATALNNLAQVYQDQREYPQAEHLYNRALAIDESVLGPESPEFAMDLNNLAVIRKYSHDYAGAEALHLRALSIRRKILSATHPDLAQSLGNLAVLYYEERDYARAAPLYLEALSIDEKVYGPEHPELATDLNNTAALYEAQDNYAAAVQTRTRTAQIRERNLTLILTTGSEKQKRLYLDKLIGETNSAISLHVRSMPTNEQAAHLALSTILRRKGRELDAMTDQIVALRRRSNPEDRELLDKLTAARTYLATLQVSGGGHLSSRQRRQKSAELDAEIESLEAEVSRRSAEFRTASQPITIEAVQHAIPSDAALIEIYSYRPFDAKAKSDIRSGPARYVAYMLRGDTKTPQWSELGDVAAINAEVARLRSALQNPQSKNVRQIARALDERVMRPIRKLLGPTRRIFLSPDGALNLIPFAALVDENGKYLMENYSVDYLTSGRDLLRLQVQKENRSAPVVMANPLYDLTAVSQLTVTGDQANQGDNESVARRRSMDFQLKTYSPLPGTAEEAIALTKLLPQGTQVFLQKQASEAILKQVKGPLLLHIATHGFFLPDETQALPLSSVSPRGSSDLPNASPSLANRENPLLRSGLVLAGVKQGESGAGEDGVLTAFEVAGLDLWGTKLVVLSACETGLGDVRNGEGVYGLRRALVLAGSETQVMSLWKVSDTGTRDLMTDYYTRLQRGEGRAEALRQVQLTMLRGQLKPTSRSGKRGTTDTLANANAKDYRHPYYWAAFIQSGDWRNMDGK
jgi:CHAT domain-containing protein/Tfp pilus assembly protein PilF